MDLAKRQIELLETFFASVKNRLETDGRRGSEAYAANS
jgi:hypothetical protein